jgi:RNA polymerase sigma factor (sigma-70 family)
MDAVAPALKPPVGVPRRLLKLRSDIALAERFAAGDDAAFAVLYERHRPSVIAVCMGVLGSTHDAEDAAQDAFASLAVSLRESPPRELCAWLARVARNAAIDVARRRRRGITSDGEVPDVPAGTSSGKVELESVIAGIRELPGSQRTALLMRELGGHTYAEIAALLEIDVEAVRGLIARARVGLRIHREASELSCAAARAALAAEPDGSRAEKTVRRHVRGCPPCRAYRQALRKDAKALRGILPGPASGVAGGGAIFGGLAAKGALLGGAVSQVTAACAVSVCAVGGVVLLYPQPRHHHIASHASGTSAAGATANSSAGGNSASRRTSTAVAAGRLSAARAATALSQRSASALGTAVRTSTRAQALSATGGPSPGLASSTRTPAQHTTPSAGNEPNGNAPTASSTPARGGDAGTSTVTGSTVPWAGGGAGNHTSHGPSHGSGASPGAPTGAHPGYGGDPGATTNAPTSPSGGGSWAQNGGASGSGPTQYGAGYRPAGGAPGSAPADRASFRGAAGTGSGTPLASRLAQVDQTYV